MTVSENDKFVFTAQILLKIYIKFTNNLDISRRSSKLRVLAYILSVPRFVAISNFSFHLCHHFNCLYIQPNT